MQRILPSVRTQLLTSILTTIVACGGDPKKSLEQPHPPAATVENFQPATMNLSLTFAML